MIPAERQRAILNALREKPVISIHELTDRLDVSHMTIRRDIIKLEQEGKVASVTGGVQLTEPLLHELPHDDKMEQQSREKRLIGMAAAENVRDGMSIYLDAGTTTLEIARAIASLVNITVITNDFVIASLLMHSSQCQLFHTGGRVDRNNQSCVGNRVADFLSNFNLDLAFISTSSWHSRGISTPAEDKVAVKRAAIRVAKSSILVTDATKYGKVAQFHVVDLDQFDQIITDSRLPAVCAEELSHRKIHLRQIP